MAMRIVGRERRKLRIRKRMSGTVERPRMSVFRSAKHIYAQVINDVSGQTIAHMSTLSKDVKGAIGDDDDKKGAATKVGEAIAKALIAKGIKKVVFDRNGYLYHGRIKALADAARKAGLEF